MAVENRSLCLTCSSCTSAPKPLARRSPSATERRLPAGGRVSLHSRSPRACHRSSSSASPAANPDARSASSGALNSACGGHAPAQMDWQDHCNK